MINRVFTIIRMYRITNTANETPITTTMHTPTAPPTTIGELSDEESGTLVFSGETAKKIINIILNHLNSYT